MTLSEKHLATYLQDHLSGSTGGIELTRRCLRHNRGRPLEPFLTRFLQELIEERTELKRLMRGLSVSELTLKRAATWILEKAGRLKLNNRLFEYSDLSRLVELETLLAGVSAKLDMWRILENLFGNDPNFVSTPLTRLRQQSEDQLECLARECLDAGRRAFGASFAAPKRGASPSRRRRRGNARLTGREHASPS